MRRSHHVVRDFAGSAGRARFGPAHAGRGRTGHPQAGRRRARHPRTGAAFAMLALAGLALAALTAGPTPARAQISVVHGEHASLDLSGYVRSLTAIHDAGFDVPGTDRRTGINAEVVRLKWQARFGDGLVLDVHNRLQAQVSTAAGGLGSAAGGIGVSAVPGRSVDLESRFVDDPRLTVWHDVDRLALTVYTPAADVTVGRQAISWGTSNLFPVADLWAQFSPFELDTEEKPGIDAVRVLAYPASGLELDAVIADRGTAEDLSVGARLTASLASMDVWGGAGKLWREVMVMGGVAVPLDQSKLRAEAVLPWELDGDTLELPRVTLGFDWLAAKLMVSAEYHFNGLGASDPSGYAARLASPSFARGESYFLGRHYAGGVVTWTADEQERLKLTLSALVNLGDPSAMLTPLVQYDVGRSTSLSLGALQSFGKTPVIAVPPELRSEYGLYGDLWFTRLSVYF